MTAGPRNPIPFERLGPFKVLRSLAKGGMSEIYLGENTGEYAGPETVVLKVWRPPAEVDAEDAQKVRELMARLIEEGRLGVRLRHPAITRSYGVMRDKERDVYFLVQDFVDGVTFGDLMDFYGENGLRIPYNVVLRLIIPVLQALHYAHHDALREDGRPLRVVHRDIKPDNIMLSYRGEVQIVDFGVARSTSLGRQVTVGGMVVGTRNYMAPEQVFEPEQVGHRSDLFSVGLILFELCSLRPVFPQTRSVKEFAENLSRFRFNDYEQLLDAKRYPGIREILQTLLVSDPKARPPSGGQLAQELEYLLKRAPTEPSLEAFARQLKEDLAEAEAAATLLGPSEEENPDRVHRNTHRVVEGSRGTGENAIQAGGDVRVTVKNQAPRPQVSQPIPAARGSQPVQTARGSGPVSTSSPSGASPGAEQVSLWQSPPPPLPPSTRAPTPPLGTRAPAGGPGPLPPQPAQGPRATGPQGSQPTSAQSGGVKTPTDPRTTGAPVRVSQTGSGSIQTPVQTSATSLLKPQTQSPPTSSLSNIPTIMLVLAAVIGMLLAVLIFLLVR